MDCDFSPSSPHLLPNGLFSPQNRISFELLALSGLSGFSTFKGGKMLIFQGFANSRIVREFPPFSFKVRIATLTRNPLAFRGPWVRIPPAPPSKKLFAFFGKELFAWKDLPSEAPSSALRFGTPPQNITGSSGNAITNSRVTTNAKSLIWMRKLSRHGLRRRFRCLRPFNCLCFTGSRQNRLC